MIQTKHIKYILIIPILATSLMAVQSHAANGNGPSFRQGEIVLSGSPDTLPNDFEILKYLPHANLTVVAVEKGKEWGMVQKYRLKGKRAGLNYIASLTGKPVKVFPNDPYFSYQWHLPAIQVEQAWEITKGIGVTVAVLDTGLATGGEDGIGCV